MPIESCNQPSPTNPFHHHLHRQPRPFEDERPRASAAFVPAALLPHAQVANPSSPATPWIPARGDREGYWPNRPDMNGSICTSFPRACAGAPVSSNTPRIAASSDSIVKATSACSACAGVSTIRTPATSPPERFHAFTACPAAARLRAISRPIAPSPMMPISISVCPPNPG